jgi:hypothetical protein
MKTTDYSQSLKNEIDAIDKQMVRCAADYESARENLSGYDTPGYEHFKSKVLRAELARLDELRRTAVDPGDAAGQERIHGQQLEVMLLMQRKDQLETAVRIAEGRMRQLQADRDKLNEKLQRRMKRDE